VLEEAIERARKVIALCTESITEYNVIHQLLSDTSNTMPLQDMFNTFNTALFWSKKELQKKDKLSKYIGTNEKTKILVILFTPSAKM